MNEKRPPHSAPFSCIKNVDPIRKEYRLGRPDLEGNRELVEVGKTDLREVVNAAYTSCFDSILDRFLDGTGDLPAPTPDRQITEDALNDAAEYLDTIEEVRRTYDLAPETSIDDVRTFLNKRYTELKDQLDRKENKHEEDQTPQNVEPKEK